jgi:hypothetical protein
VIVRGPLSAAPCRGGARTTGAEAAGELTCARQLVDGALLIRDRVAERAQLLGSTAAAW